jgi:hypothetical protein
MYASFPSEDIVQKIKGTHHYASPSETEQSSQVSKQL